MFIRGCVGTTRQLSKNQNRSLITTVVIGPVERCTFLVPRHFTLSSLTLKHGSSRMMHTKWPHRYFSSGSSHKKPQERGNNSLVREKTQQSNLTKEEEAQAEKMFQELNELVEKRKQKQLAQQEKTWGQAITKFFKQSKHQLINIAASFVCLVLAMQVADSRIGLRKKNQRLEEMDQEMSELKQKVDFLRGNDFSNLVAQDMQHHVPEPSCTSWFSKILSSSQHFDEEEKLETEELSSILQKHISRVLGHIQTSQAEKDRSEMEMIQSLAMGLSGDGGSDALNPAAKELAQAVDAVDNEEEEEKNEDGVTVIKKRRMMF
jgi:hypothetical protein